MAVVGGCCPGPSGAPGVGPEPASRAARIFDRFSMSLVHWLAPAAPICNARSAQLARMTMVFIGHTPLARRAGGGREPSGINSHGEMAFRRSGPHGVANAAPARPPLEHDPEKWTPVFGKDHAPSMT